MTAYKIKSAVLAFVISFSLTAATLIATAVPVQAAPVAAASSQS